jgi:mutator protein MutT
VTERREGPPQVVVAALIERGARVLVSQRPPGVGHGGRWEFPGGKRERGETDEAALRRELWEELDVELDVGGQVWRAPAGALEIRFYRCAWRAGQRPRPLGCAQFRWVRRTDLASYAFPPADAAFVRALVEGRLAGVARGRGRQVG